ncbi:fibronectin type III domain-containing protein [Candidatus Bipolaricaulota sp. J31]
MKSRWVFATALLLAIAAINGCDIRSFLVPIPDIPQDVRASDGTFADKVRITWSASAAAALYIVYRADSENGDYQEVGSTSETAFDDTSVVPGTVYWYKVQACNNAGCSATSTADFGYAGEAEEQLPPAAPTGLSASDGTYTDRVRVTWDEVSGAAFYEVYRTLNPTGTFTQIGQTSSPPYDDLGVTQGTTYWYRVKACNQAGCSPFSSADGGYASPGRGGGEEQVPGIPGNVTATKGEYLDKVRIAWETVSGASYYEVFRSTTEGGTYAQIAETGSTSYDDVDDAASPVEPCKSYWYKVRACNDNGCGDFSAPAEGWREHRMTQPPENITATDGTRSDGVLVSWDPVPYADKYKVYRDTSSTGTFTDCIAGCTDVQTQSSYLDTSATPGVDYWYRIAACSEYTSCGPYSGCSGLSTPVRGSRSCLPQAPTNVSATESGGQVTISWDPASSPAGYPILRYEIYRATAEGGPYTKIGETPDGTTTQFTDTPPAPGAGEQITYYYKVKACNSCGCSPLSQATSVTLSG